MTVHGAKGLEFDRVILADLDRGLSAGGRDKVKVRVLEEEKRAVINRTDYFSIGEEEDVSATSLWIVSPTEGQVFTTQTVSYSAYFNSTAASTASCQISPKNNGTFTDIGNMTNATLFSSTFVVDGTGSMQFNITCDGPSGQPDATRGYVITYPINYTSVLDTNKDVGEAIGSSHTISGNEAETMTMKASLYSLDDSSYRFVNATIGTCVVSGGSCSVSNTSVWTYNNSDFLDYFYYSTYAEDSLGGKSAIANTSLTDMPDKTIYVWGNVTSTGAMVTLVNVS